MLSVAVENLIWISVLRKTQSSTRTVSEDMVLAGCMYESINRFYYYHYYFLHMRCECVWTVYAWKHFSISEWKTMCYFIIVENWLNVNVITDKKLVAFISIAFNLFQIQIFAFSQIWRKFNKMFRQTINEIPQRDAPLSVNRIIIRFRSSKCTGIKV